MWLKILLEWSLLGIAFLFFLVLGFKGLGAFSPALNPTDIQGAGFWTDLLAKIKGWFIYYFCLFVYLLLVSIISKRLMPTFAEGLISGAKEMGGMIWTAGLKPLSKVMRSQMARTGLQYEKIREGAERKRKRRRRSHPYRKTLTFQVRKGACGNNNHSSKICL